MVEPPPSPKPWRGRTWSNDSWRTSLTANLTADESSQESVSDWHGIGAGFGGTAGVTAAADDTVNGNVVVGGGGGYGSGGGRASGNGGSGGGSAADVVLAGGKEGCTADGGRGRTGEGSKHARSCHEMAHNGDIRGEDAADRVASSNGALGTNNAVANGSALAGGGLAGKGNDTVMRGCRASPPSVSGPGGAFGPQHRRGHGGRKRVEARTVAFSTFPPEMFSPADVDRHGVAEKKSQPEGRQQPPFGEKDEAWVTQRRVAAEGVAQGGVGLPRGGGDGDGRDQAANEATEAATAAGGRGTLVASSGEGQWDAVGHVDDGNRTAGGEDGGGARDVAATVVGGENKTAIDAKVKVGREGAKVDGPMLVSCAPVRASSTRLAVRQWRHLFLP